MQMDNQGTLALLRPKVRQTPLDHLLVRNPVKVWEIGTIICLQQMALAARKMAASKVQGRKLIVHLIALTSSTRKLILRKKVLETL